jgi:hypothetical protein
LTKVEIKAFLRSTLNDLPSLEVNIKSPVESPSSNDDASVLVSVVGSAAMENEDNTTRKQERIWIWIVWEGKK